MKKLTRAIQSGIILAGAAGLAACGGGGGSTAESASTVTVAPVLGKFGNGAHVTITKPNGEVLGKADTAGGSGKAVVSIQAGYSGPLLIEVTGDTGVQYWDEGASTSKDFGTGSVLRAIAPDTRAQVGVTTATNAVVAAIRIANGNAIPATISGDTIKAASAKIEAALGISDVLQLPALVDSGTLKTLNLSRPEDRYALQLAALAKLATSGKSALDVALDIANDLSDGKLDGTSAAGPNTSTSYDASTVKQLMEDKQKLAVAELGDAGTNSLLASDASALGAIIPDVTQIKAPDGVNLSDLQKAKSMFHELRTTLNSFSNGNKTGFLDVQAKRAGDDLDANVTPQLEKVANRIDALDTAMDTFEAAQSNTQGFSVDSNPLTKAAALFRASGNINAVWYGYGSVELCWAESTKITCAYAGPNSADYVNNKIKMVVFVLSATATPGQYTYTATRRNMSVVSSVSGVTPNGIGAPVTGLPVGSGTVGRTVADGETLAFNLDGTLTPSTAACVTSTSNCPADQVVINATRTALPAAANYRYTMSGSVTTENAVEPLKAVSLSIGSGSYFDLDRSNAANDGGKPVALVLNGSAQTAASKFTGSLTVDAFKTDADLRQRVPTSVVFNGSISDTSSGGAATFLTGKLEAKLNDYNTYHSAQSDSASNYRKLAMTFTGTVQAPSRPLMTLGLAASATGPDTGSMTLKYTYGTASIIGSGTVGSGLPVSMTLSNQDGIAVVLNPDGSISVSKSGTKLASIVDDMVKYVDGSSESMM